MPWEPSTSLPIIIVIIIIIKSEPKEQHEECALKHHLSRKIKSTRDLANIYGKPKNRTPLHFSCGLVLIQRELWIKYWLVNFQKSKIHYSICVRWKKKTKTTFASYAHCKLYFRRFFFLVIASRGFRSHKWIKCVCFQFKEWYKKKKKN